MSLEELEVGSLLRILHWLPSVDAFRCIRACRALRYHTGDGCGALQFWSRAVPTGSPAGRHSGSMVWLHGLLDAASIEEYMRRLSGVVLLEELSFSSPGEVSRLLLELERVRGHPVALAEFSPAAGSGSLFVGSWRLAPLDPEDELSSVRSSAVGFCCMHGVCRTAAFDVILALSSDASGSLTASWETAFRGQVSTEELDYVEVELTGSVVAPCGEFPALPVNGSQFQSGMVTRMADQRWTPSQAASIWDELRSGVDLTCVLRIVFLGAGVEQRVLPTAVAQARKRTDSLEADTASHRQQRLVPPTCGNLDLPAVPSPEEIQEHILRRLTSSAEHGFDADAFEHFLETAHVASG